MMKLLIHSQTSTVPPLKFGNEYVISYHILLGMWLLVNAVIKVQWTHDYRECRMLDCNMS